MGLLTRIQKLHDVHWVEVHLHTFPVILINMRGTSHMVHGRRGTRVHLPHGSVLPGVRDTPISRCNTVVSASAETPTVVKVTKKSQTASACEMKGSWAMAGAMRSIPT